MWALDRVGSDQKTMSTCSTVYGRRGGKAVIDFFRKAQTIRLREQNGRDAVMHKFALEHDLTEPIRWAFHRRGVM